MTRRIRGFWLRGAGWRRPRLCRWPRFTLFSTLLLLGVAASIGLLLPAWIPVASALALFALIHAGFLCVLEPEPAEGR